MDKFEDYAISDAYLKGRKDNQDGFSINSCPYPEGPLKEYWIMGFNDFQAIRDGEDCFSRM